jgi:hypothetical protein
MNTNGGCRFSITNLMLLERNYPYDFMLRIKTVNPEEVKNSPMIDTSTL